MAFDDLARHMASRDGKTSPQARPVDLDQFLVDAAESNRRLDRTRDLVLGPILLVGGLVILTLIALYLLDAFDSTPDPLRPPPNGVSPDGRFKVWVPIGGIVAVAGLVIVGLQRTIRGLRGRSQASD